MYTVPQVQSQRLHLSTKLNRSNQTSEVQESIESFSEDFHCFNRKQGTNDSHVLLMWKWWIQFVSDVWCAGSTTYRTSTPWNNNHRGQNHPPALWELAGVSATPLSTVQLRTMTRLQHHPSDVYMFSESCATKKKVKYEFCRAKQRPHTKSKEWAAHRGMGWVTNKHSLLLIEMARECPVF
jgi:hypothetical protein